MKRTVIAGLALALGLVAGGCTDIPSCDDVDCLHPMGSEVEQFDGILQPAPQAFTPTKPMPDDSEGGAARI